MRAIDKAIKKIMGDKKGRNEVFTPNTPLPGTPPAPNNIEIPRLPEFRRPPGGL
jgi:hypothetical protein